MEISEIIFVFAFTLWNNEFLWIQNHEGLFSKMLEKHALGKHSVIGRGGTPITERWRACCSPARIVFHCNLCYPFNGAYETISLPVFKSMKCMVIETWISDGKLIAQFIQQLISWCYNWLAVNKCFSYWLAIWWDTIQTEVSSDVEMPRSIIQNAPSDHVNIDWDSMKFYCQSAIKTLWLTHEEYFLFSPLFICSDHTWCHLK